MGGTEATVLRVAQGLAAIGYIVHLQQHNRINLEADDYLTYSGPDNVPSHAYRYTITLRNVRVYNKIKAIYKHAKNYLWLHDVFDADNASHITPDTSIVAVSNWHASQIKSLINTYLQYRGEFFPVTVNTVYNPLADYVTYQQTVYDPYKLLFFSSPHKGIERAVFLAEVLHRMDERYKLYIANPGYFNDTDYVPEGVINLGKLTHKEMIAHLRTALCSFLVNNSFPETFGLVMAESDAVGTPVLTHSIGASREVLDHPDELIEAGDPASIIKRVFEWSAGARPTVRGKAAFSLKSVLQAWKRLLK